MPFQIVYCALHLFARENEEKLLKIDLKQDWKSLSCLSNYFIWFNDWNSNNVVRNI